MADTKITGLTANTTPAGGDLLPLVDIGTVVTQKITVDDLMTKAPYVLRATSTGNTPADATSYYFGGFEGAAMGAAAANQRLYIPRTGTITKAYVFMTFVNGSNETSTMSIRKNDTTDTTISSAIACNATPFAVSNTGLSVAVTAGDYVTIKWVTPTWATNPTSLSVSVLLFVA